MSPSALRHPARIPVLDAARAAGVIAMVCGHTLDALLSPAARADPLVSAYWSARGLTAPLFLVVAGWAVAASASRCAARGWPVLAARLPRVLLLLAAGYGLRYPAWATDAFLAGHRETWRHFLAFDALHCVALGLLAAAAILSAAETLRARLAALAAATAVLLAAAPLLPSIRATGIPEIAFEQILRGTSPFPVVPWAAYFLVGCALGLLARDASRLRLAVALGCSGAALVACAHAAGLGALPVWSPVLVALRTGQVLVGLAALSLVPPSLAARLAPIGRASLFVYVVHVPVLYGWGTWQGLAQRVGPVLGLPAAAAAAAALLAATLVAGAIAGRARPALAAGWSAAACRLGLAARADGAERPQLTHQ